jgi:Cation transporter/ATPase, N-terminus
LAEAPPPPWWRKVLVHLAEPVVLILLAAAVVSAVVGDWTDALAILAIVFLNALLGLYQEQRAEQALTSLRRLSAPPPRWSGRGPSDWCLPATWSPGPGRVGGRGPGPGRRALAVGRRAAGSGGGPDGRIRAGGRTGKGTCGSSGES